VWLVGSSSERPERQVLWLIAVGLDSPVLGGTEMGELCCAIAQPSTTQLVISDRVRRTLLAVGEGLMCDPFLRPPDQGRLPK
jgi:hypothetical protein